jgi:hypothetical protein
MGAVARPGRIRIYGPLMALVIPLVMGALAFAAHSSSCTGTACVRPGAVTWGLVLLIAPSALLAGLPWFAGPISLGATAVSSLIMWLAFGRWAARRATREDVDAGWLAYWRELGFIVAGLWAGVLLGLGIIYLYFTAL